MVALVLTVAFTQCSLLALLWQSLWEIGAGFGCGMCRVPRSVLNVWGHSVLQGSGRALSCPSGGAGGHHPWVPPLGTAAREDRRLT